MTETPQNPDDPTPAQKKTIQNPCDQNPPSTRPAEASHKEDPPSDGLPQEGLTAGSPKADAVVQGLPPTELLPKSTVLPDNPTGRLSQAGEASQAFPKVNGAANPPIQAVGGDVDKKLKINQGRVIDLHWCLNFFEKRGKETYGEKFRICQEDHEVIFKLIIYFLGHQQEAHRLGPDLRKGILLTGLVGCGKTSLMNLMRLIPPQSGYTHSNPAATSPFEFIQVVEAVDFWVVAVVWPRSSSAVTINTLPRGMLTHITTNLSATEIETAYTTRVRSRLREMLNLISFNPKTSDKRK